MSTATFMKDLSANFTGEAHLYRLDPPLKSDWDAYEDGYEYVVVSAAVVPFVGGQETYIFPADEDGEVLSWGELPGSYRGGLDHVEALRGAGYEVSR